MFLPLDCGDSLFGPCFVINILGVLSCFAIILTRKRKHDAVRCLPTISVLWLFLMVPWTGQKYYARINVSCSMTRRSEADEARYRGPLVSSSQCLNTKCGQSSICNCGTS